MTRTELKKLHNLECKNIQWSWAFVNHEENFIVVQVFSEQNKNKVYSPTWGKKTQPSHKEFKEYLDLVTEHDYDIKVVQATGYLDTDTNTFRLTGYNGKTLFNARLEIDSNREVWFYPAKDGVEKISSKD
jgi:hypothetical protein